MRGFDYIGERALAGSIRNRGLRRNRRPRHKGELPAHCYPALCNSGRTLG
jgi:ribosomal protein L25 (general stress protein Ctc)